MTDNSDNNRSDGDWKKKAAGAAGAAVGSAAIAAALLWVKKRSDKANEQPQPPLQKEEPDLPPETD